jgi:hypothetical protein
MPRLARIHEPGTIVHVVTKFVNDAFRLAGPVERDAYLARIPRALEGTDTRVFSHGLMSSHGHLGLLVGHDHPSRFMRRLNTGFAQFANRQHGCRGPVFAERYFSVSCDERHAANLVAYIHNNPVDAQVADDPSATDWTSHRAYLGLDPAPEWLDVQLGLSLSGFDCSDEGRQAFHRFVCGRAGVGETEFEPVGANKARWFARDRAGSAAELSHAITAPEGGGKAYIILAPRGAVVRDRWKGQPRSVARVVAKALGVTEAEIRSTSRVRRVVRARRMALDVWHHHLGRDVSSMCAYQGISRQAGSRLLARRAPQRTARKLASLVRASSRTS